MSCILPTMHFRSQTCWELLHPFAHYCQHARNNSQHCCSCCTRLHAALRSILHLSLIFLLINKSLYDELINRLTETEMGSRTISTLSKQRQNDWFEQIKKLTTINKLIFVPDKIDVHCIRYYRSFSPSRNKKINRKPSSGRSQENEML